MVENTARTAGRVDVCLGRRRPDGDAGGEVGLVHSRSPVAGFRSFERITPLEVVGEGIALRSTRARKRAI